MRFIVLVLAAMLWASSLYAQSVPNGGAITPGQVWTPTQWTNAWQSKLDANNPVLSNPTINGGTLNGVNVGSSTTTPSGAPSAMALSDVAAQTGTALDAFFVQGDTDYSAALTRACAAGSPILLAAKTYTINNFSGCAITTFTLRGIKGKSVIQRTAASGSNWFTISATNVNIDGIIFDSNKGSVSANQWGVLLNHGGQNINITNSVFKNNSGSLGSCLALLSTGPSAGGSFVIKNSEITGCTFDPLFLASVSNGDVEGNYIHDNSTSGAFIIANGAASGTNYSTNILIRGNRFLNNTGAGLSMGSFAPPYAYGTPAATWINVIGNLFQDNSTYQVSLTNADHVSVVGNQIKQSSSGVSTTGGIDCNSRYPLIEANDLLFPAARFGIDCGGAVEPTIRNNNVNMGNGGSAIDVGGVQNGQVINNHVSLTGTGTAVIIFDMETDGSNNPFPNHTSNVAVHDNDIILSGTTALGVETLDDAGATAGALPVSIIGNRFIGINSATASQDVTYFANAPGIVVQGNTHNGVNGIAVQLNVNTDYVFETVYDYIQGDLTAGSVRAIVNSFIQTYNSGTSILWVLPTAGGSGYTAATTLSANGGCTWTGTPLISAGVIVGVRTTAVGASCSGGTAITATDSGGGSGATFSVGVAPKLPAGKMIQYRSSAGNVLQTGGGAVPIHGTANPIPVANGYYLTLQADATGAVWQVTANPSLSAFTVSGLPTCNSSYNKSTVLVTDANAPTYNGTLTGGSTSVITAICDGSNWRAH